MDATHGSRPACSSQFSGSSRKSGVVGQRTMASGSHVQFDPSLSGGSSGGRLAHQPMPAVLLGGFTMTS
jgi:hypothetical protein